MLWKNYNEYEKKLKQMNAVLKKSFTNVKSDTTNIFQWLNYFYRKSAEQEQKIRQLQLELSYAPKTSEDIRRIIDYYYSFESIISKIRELDNRIDELSRKQVNVGLPTTITREIPLDLQAISYIEKRLEKLEEKKLSIKEKIIKKLTRNSKEYVKSVIISYIKKYEKISALQLKEIVVDEQKFCSKSSFYRLLVEIEQFDDIGVIKHGNEKLYISKAVKRI